MKLAKIIKHCRIDKPEKFKLADFDPAEAFGLPSRAWMPPARTASSST
jgi:hypothetical protein